jgi:hypothetical protein
VTLLRQLLSDTSSASLLFSNLLTIVLAVVQGWRLADVMWVYWGQSVVIGYFNWRRIRALQRFSTDGFTVNDHPVDPTPATKRQVALFFAVHYGFFHFVYLVFLLSFPFDTQRSVIPHSPFPGQADTPRPDVLGIAVCTLAFAVNHAFSYRHNLESDLRRVPNIGTVMFFPYARILPMHLTLILGGFFGAVSSVLPLVVFLVLKTLADLIMHLVEHGEWRLPRPPDSSAP